MEAFPRPQWTSSGDFRPGGGDAKKVVQPYPARAGGPAPYWRAKAVRIEESGGLAMQAPAKWRTLELVERPADEDRLGCPDQAPD